MITLFDPSEEHAALRQTTRRFAEAEVLSQARQADQEETFNQALFERAGALGLLGVLGPEEAGGANMDLRAMCVIFEELAWADPGFALAVLSHAVLFIGTLREGAAGAHDEVMRRASSGGCLGALAMSEPEAGTDVMAMRSRAKKTEAGGYVIDGTKMWITNGAPTRTSLPDAALVYARTSDDSLRGLSLFLLKKEDEGFSLGRPVTGKLGMRAASCAELHVSRCHVSQERRIGPEGGGAMLIMKTLATERLALAAIGCGLGMRALEIANGYASARKVEGKPLRFYGQIQRHLAESYAELKSARALTYCAAAELEITGETLAPMADAAKLSAASAAENATHRAIQVLGGNGYIADFDVERLWRDARLLSIGGGSNEALQKNITRALARHKGRLS